MNTQRLANILHDIAVTDLDALDCNGLVGWLVRCIHRRAGVDRVVAWCAPMVEPASDPNAEGPVYAGSTSAEHDPKVARLSELRVLGKHAVLGDRRAVTHEVVRGPRDDPYVPLSPDRGD